MTTFRSEDAHLAYEMIGAGPDVVLLHPFPLHLHFWDGVLDQLASRYRIILPDLRAHGDSEVGEGAVTMRKLADDLDRLCRELEVKRAIFVGVSIGGYTLFEFWRRHRERVRALVLANTRSGAETAEGRTTRLAIADKVTEEKNFRRRCGNDTHGQKPQQPHNSKPRREFHAASKCAAGRRGTSCEYSTFARMKRADEFPLLRPAHRANNLPCASSPPPSPPDFCWACRAAALPPKVCSTATTCPVGNWSRCLPPR